VREKKPVERSGQLRRSFHGPLSQNAPVGHSSPWEEDRWKNSPEESIIVFAERVACTAQLLFIESMVH
jgi:hypothetical protein